MYVCMYVWGTPHLPSQLGSYLSVLVSVCLVGMESWLRAFMISRIETEAVLRAGVR